MPATNSFTIEGRNISHDIQRSFLWQLWIPVLPILPSSLFNKQLSSDDFTVACKTVSIPSREIEVVETYFYGQKQLFPVNQVCENKLDITVEEREDQLVYTTFSNWMLAICNNDPSSINATLSSLLTKKQYAVDVWLKFYKYSGSNMEYAIRLKNCFPISMSNVALDYNSNNAIQYNITLSFDNQSIIRG
jgi:hypothetical protein